MELSPWAEADVTSAAATSHAPSLSSTLSAMPVSLMSPRQLRQRKAEAAAEERLQRTQRAQALVSIEHSAVVSAAAASSNAAASVAPALHSACSLPLIDSAQPAASAASAASATATFSASPSQARLKAGSMHRDSSVQSIAPAGRAHAVRTLQLPSPPKQPQQTQPQPQHHLSAPSTDLASLQHSQSVPAVNSASARPGAAATVWSSSGGPLSPLSFSRSTASLGASASAAHFSSPRSKARNAVNSRLYANSSVPSLLPPHGSMCPPLSVPRPLPAPSPQSVALGGPLIARWMALLAWERGGAEGLMDRVRSMEAMLAEQIREHQLAMETAVKDEVVRVRERAEAQSARLQRRAALLAEADAAVPAHLRRPKVRFGGVLQQSQPPQSAESEGPSTLRIPAHHAAFVCDMLERACESTGRTAPLMRRIVHLLFQACYQGFDEGSDHAQPARLLLSAASAEEKQQQAGSASQSDSSTAAASTPSVSASSTPAPLVLPYFHVSHLLSVEFHRGRALIDAYVDTQQCMHVQSLRRADVLNGSVRRMQSTLSYHVFQRWRFVARQRRRQLAASKALMARWMHSPAHVKVHFLTWKSHALNSRASKDEQRHTAANQAVSSLQSEVAAARKSCVAESGRLQSSRDCSKSLHRQRDELLRQIRLVELQQSALNDRGLHRLLDGSFEILRAAIDALSAELEGARGLDLQDPLRILHPTRTSWEWDTVYSDAPIGSQLWAHARRRELEAARAFFDGSAIVHESNLAHTKAAAGATSTSTSAAAAASSGSAPKPKHGHSASMAFDHSSPATPGGGGVRGSNMRGTPSSGGHARRRTASGSEHPARHHRSASTSSFAGAPSASTGAGSSSSSSSAYNYSQEVELILLWMNFHLIQSQNKILVAKQEQMQRRALDKKRRKAAAAEASAAAARVAAKTAAPGGKRTLGQSSSTSSLQSVSVDDAGESAGEEGGEMDWFDGAASASASTGATTLDDKRKESEAKNRRARSNLQQGRASLSANILERVFSPHASATASDKTQSSTAAEAVDAASSESQLKSRSYFVAQFTSAEALARRCDNFTTSLQDGELLLRLLSEVAPPGVADTEMLMHVDLQSRARLLIRMLERWDPDLSNMVTSLDFVHAFNSDRVAALLARLWIKSPQTGIQGAWFDADDFSNQTGSVAAAATTTAADGTQRQAGRKPFLRATDPRQLAQQMDDAAAGAEGGGDFGPLHQLHLELAQLQHAATARHRISVACIHELHAAVKRTLSAGRRILDDAYARHDLWLALRNRMKSFVVSILVAHVRGRPLKLDDPRALAERQSFCALLDSPMHAMLRKQKERLEASERARQTAALSSTIASAIENMRTASTEAEAAAAQQEEALDALHFPFGKPQSRFMDLMAEDNRTYDTRADARSHETGADGATNAHAQPASVQSIPAYLTVAGTTKQQPAAPSIDASTVSSLQPAPSAPRHTREGSGDSDEDAGRLSGLSALAAADRLPSSSRRSSFAAPDVPAPAPASAVVSLPHVLSFELHVIQNLLHVFYEPLKQIWRAYAQADTGKLTLGSTVGSSSQSAGTIASSNSMNLLETWALVRDCGLCVPSASGAAAASGSSLSAKQVEQVFLECFMSASEKSSPASKAATAAQGSLSMLTALVFDPATGLAAPPKDKSQLELNERDFIELLVRIAFLRRVSARERRETLAEWRGFQSERREEMRREKQRKREQAQAQRRAIKAARRKEAGLDDSFSASLTHASADSAAANSEGEEEEDADLFSDEDSDADTDEGDEPRRQLDFDNAMSPLAGTVSGSRASFHDRLYEGMSAGSGETGSGGSGSLLLDETFGVDVSDPNAAHVHLGLSLRVFGLLKLRLLPHATKLDSEGFRAAYKTRAVSRQFRRHGTQLKRLFFHYATMHSIAVSALDGARADSWDNTIDYSEYLTLLRDLHLLESSSSAAAAAAAAGSSSASSSATNKGGALLSHDQCYSIFANVQQDLHVANAALTSSKVQRNQPWAPTPSLAHSASAAALAERNAAAAAAAVEAEKIKQAAQKAKRQSKRQSQAAAKGKGGAAAPVPAAVAAALSAKLQKRLTLDRQLTALEESAATGPSVTRVSTMRGSISDLSAAAARSKEDAEDAESDDAEGGASDNEDATAAAAPAVAETLPSASASEPTTAASAPSGTPDVGLSRARDFHGSPTASASESPVPPEPLSAEQAATGDGNPLLSATATHLSSSGLAASASQSSCEMIYPEYLEALAAIACCRYPNPYKTTADKIETFLDCDVLPQIPKLLRRQHSMALTVNEE